MGRGRTRLRQLGASSKVKVLMDAGYGRRQAEGALELHDDAMDEAQDFLDANPDYEGEDKKAGLLKGKIDELKSKAKARVDEAIAKAQAEYKEKYGNAAKGSNGTRIVELNPGASKAETFQEIGPDGRAIEDKKRKKKTKKSGGLSMLAADEPTAPYEYAMVEMDFSVARFDRIGTTVGKLGKAGFGGGPRLVAKPKKAKDKVGKESTEGGGGDDDEDADDDEGMELMATKTAAADDWHLKPMPQSYEQKSYDPKTMDKNVSSTIKEGNSRI